ncbi:MAG: acyltransferase [Clostridia bacterium]|nr:acyltransferase [Clostridia bacterium]
MSILSHRYLNRHTGLEMLRIIAMLMIITLHFFSHGLKGAVSGDANIFLFRTVYAFAFASVNIFFMITGYFMVNSCFKLSRIANVWIETVFYSLLIGIVLFCQHSISIVSLIQSFFPYTTNSYWFISNYLLLLFISPFLNKLIQSVNKKSFISLIAVLLFFFSLIPSIFAENMPLGYNRGYDVIWAVVMYFVGAYINLYKIRIKKSTNIILYFVVTMAVPASFFIISKLESLNNSVISAVIGCTVGGPKIMYDYSSVLIFLSSVLLFIIFLNLDIKNIHLKKIIVFFSSLSFAVYIIHDNNLIRECIWQFINPTKYSDDMFLLVYMILCVVAVFFVCCFVEFIRQQTFGRILKKIELNKKIDNVQNRIKNGIEKKLRNKGV